MLHFYTAGESHGQALLAFVSGLPAWMPVDVAFINRELYRRQLGYGRGGRQKIEKDDADIFAGVRHGQTIGAPIALRIENRDWANWEKILPVEGLAEGAAAGKDRKSWWRRGRGMRIWRGRRNLIFTMRGMCWSGLRRGRRRRGWRRGRLRNCCCGNLGRRLRAIRFASGIWRWSERRRGRRLQAISGDMESPLRCVDGAVQEGMKAEVDAALKAGNTVGGIFEVVAHNVPVGLGSHAQWDEKLDGRLAQAVMSIQAVKGVEIGAGVSGGGLVWQRSAGRDFLRCGGEESFSGRRIAPAGLEGGITNGAGCRGARVSEADFDAAAGAGDGGHGDEGAGAGGLRALGLVRGAGGGRGWRGDGRTCAGRCFSAKIWRRLPPGDAAEFRQLCPTN